VKVNGVWRYVYRAHGQYGQVIDVLVSTRRDAGAARRFFHRALKMLKVVPSVVSPTLLRSIRPYSTS
jgi:transposase-like protein